MKYEEFYNRCYHEFHDKNPGKKERLDKTLDIVYLIIHIIAIIIAFASPFRFNYDRLINTIISLAIYCIVCMILSKIVEKISDIILYQLPRSVIKNAEQTHSFLNFPSNYPNSFLYAGETYPFENKTVPPVIAPAPASTPVAPAPASTPVAPAPAPESVVLSCEKCGQQMLIPPNSGAVKITCPKCGNSFIHKN